MKETILHHFKGAVQDLLPHFYGGGKSLKLVIVAAFPQRISLIQDSMRLEEGRNFLWENCYFLTPDQLRDRKYFERDTFFIFDEIGKIDWEVLYQRDVLLPLSRENIFLTCTKSDEEVMRNCLSFFKKDRREKLTLISFTKKEKEIYGQHLWPSFSWAYLQYLLEFSHENILIVMKNKHECYRLTSYFQQKKIESSRIILTHEKRALSFETYSVRHIFLFNLVNPEDWKKEFRYFQGDGSWEYYQDSHLLQFKIPSLNIIKSVMIQKGRDFLCAS